ncbi:MAG: aminopeptidase P family N-terminal domain-containing protein, partial [Pseudomonadota bacterium]|nr:aminopeptidase P family N-terminal domain-containing protein [Pseudomonadota bacterium]
MLSRRALIQSAAATSLVASAGFAGTPPMPRLKSLTGDAKPISVEERRGRIARMQTLMAQRKIAALLVEPGSSLDYFTGIRWRRSERTTLAIIPASGEILVVTPAFEEPSVRETLQVGGEVRPWDEHESPFEKIVQGLKDRGINSGVLAAESTIRFFIVAGIRQAGGAYDIIPADPLVRACRLIKSPAELALLQLANDVTIEALRQVHAQVAKDMSTADIAALMDNATSALGGSPEFSLILLNEASAYP